MNSEGQNPTPGRVRLPQPRSRRGPKAYLAEVMREMKKVQWPNRKETTRLTGVVLAVCLIVVAILSGLSWVFGTLVTLLTRGAGA
jgi:preprotein translocase SecE subunit